MLAAFPPHSSWPWRVDRTPRAEAVRIVRSSGVTNETNSRFTNLEGDGDDTMGVIRACVEKFAQSAPRVTLLIKIDHRPGVSPGALTRDVESSTAVRPQTHEA